jgi:protein ImuB
MWAMGNYFRVEPEAGARFWLFWRGDRVDGQTGNQIWSLHGIFGWWHAMSNFW